MRTIPSPSIPRRVLEWEPSLFRPAWFCPGPHFQSLWGDLLRRRPDFSWRRERWETPDGDFLDIDFLDQPAPGAPVLLLLHGLEGSSNSHYMRGLAAGASGLGWGAAALNFRSCGGEPNRAPRLYHSAETGDIDFFIRRMAARAEGPLVIAGFSLGGNVLLKWLGQSGENLPESLVGAAAISASFEAGESVRVIDRPGGAIYRRPLLATLVQKALDLAERHPGLVEPDRVRGARTFLEFDRWVTAPVHGYADERAYYAAASSLGDIPKIRLPALLLSARDDPIVPERSYPARAVSESSWLRGLLLPAGGHVGFIGGENLASPLFWGEENVLSYLAACAGERAG